MLYFKTIENETGSTAMALADNVLTVCGERYLNANKWTNALMHLNKTHLVHMSPHYTYMGRFTDKPIKFKQIRESAIISKATEVTVIADNLNILYRNAKSIPTKFDDYMVVSCETSGRLYQKKYTVKLKPIHQI